MNPSDEEKAQYEKFIDDASTASSEGRMTIVLFQDKDGNWRGGKQTNSKDHVYVRDVGPETVLQLLLTHDGK